MTAEDTRFIQALLWIDGRRSFPPGHIPSTDIRALKRLRILTPKGDLTNAAREILTALAARTREHPDPESPAAA